jgi:hypothetical protein
LLRIIALFRCDGTVVVYLISFSCRSVLGPGVQQQDFKPYESETACIFTAQTDSPIQQFLRSELTAEFEVTTYSRRRRFAQILKWESGATTCWFNCKVSLR